MRPISYDDLLSALRRDLTEEAAAVRTLVEDEDASCPWRALRRERLRTLEAVLGLLEQYQTWDWAAPICGREDISTTIVAEVPQ
jgi:hypothetical protein